jgi:hypothetical protein
MESTHLHGKGSVTRRSSAATNCHLSRKRTARRRPQRHSPNNGTRLHTWRCSSGQVPVAETATVLGTASSASDTWQRGRLGAAKETTAGGARCCDLSCSRRRGRLRHSEGQRPTADAAAPSSAPARAVDSVLHGAAARRRSLPTCGGAPPSVAAEARRHPSMRLLTAQHPPSQL